MIDADKYELIFFVSKWGVNMGETWQVSTNNVDLVLCMYTVQCVSRVKLLSHKSKIGQIKMSQGKLQHYLAIKMSNRNVEEKFVVTLVPKVKGILERVACTFSGC